MYNHKKEFYFNTRLVLYTVSETNSRYSPEVIYRDSDQDCESGDEMTRQVGTGER